MNKKARVIKTDKTQEKVKLISAGRRMPVNIVLMLEEWDIKILEGGKRQGAEGDNSHQESELHTEINYIAILLLLIL